MKRIVLLALCLALLTGSACAAVAVRMDGEAALLAGDGAVIVAAGTFSDIVPLGGDRFAAMRDGASYALMDEAGALLSEVRYDELRLCGGLLCANRDGGWGLLSSDGAELCEFDYSEIITDELGNCWALREEDEASAVWLLDADGSARDSGVRVNDAGEPGGGLLPVVTEGGLWGCCDAEGKLAVPAEFEWIGTFRAGRAPAVADGKYGAIDEAGNWIVAPEYDFLEVAGVGFTVAASENGARVLAADGSTLDECSGTGAWVALAGEGYIIGDDAALRVCDASGAIIEELAPDASVSEGVGVQLVISEGMWGEACVRLSGTEAKYQNLYPLGTAQGEPVYAFMEANAARYQNDLLHEIQVSVDMDSARYGLVNGAGEVILPCGYLSIRYLADDRFLVRDENQWRVLNSWGKVYWRSNGVKATPHR